MKIASFVIVLTLVVLKTNAQQKLTANELKDSIYYAKMKTPHLDVGLSFMSNEVYNG